MNELNNYLRQDLYTPILVFLPAVLALVLHHRARRLGMGYFAFYFVAYLLGLFCMFAITTQAHKPYFHTLLHLTPVIDLFETVVEFLVFFHFALVALGGRHRRPLQLIRLVFLATAGLLFLYDMLRHGRLYDSTLSFLFVLQAVSLLVPCILYYINIFRFTPVSSLGNEPAFWVITGLSFMLICTFPLSLFFKYMEPNTENPIFAIFYVFYSLFFIMIIRAYLCIPTSSRS